jgi:hypothetical protein
MYLYSRWRGSQVVPTTLSLDRSAMPAERLLQPGIGLLILESLKQKVTSSNLGEEQASLLALLARLQANMTSFHGESLVKLNNKLHEFYIDFHTREHILSQLNKTSTSTIIEIILSLGSSIAATIAAVELGKESDTDPHPNNAHKRSINLAVVAALGFALALVPKFKNASERNLERQVLLDQRSKQIEMLYVFAREYENIAPTMTQPAEANLEANAIQIFYDGLAHVQAMLLMKKAPDNLIAKISSYYALKTIRNPNKNECQSILGVMEEVIQLSEMSSRNIASGSSTEPVQDSVFVELKNKAGTVKEAASFLTRANFDRNHEIMEPDNEALSI